MPRRILIGVIGALLSAPLYLLLVDTVELPELVAAAVTACISAAAFAAACPPARSAPTATVVYASKLLAGVAVRLPRDVYDVCREIFAQLLSPQQQRGRWVGEPDGPPQDEIPPGHRHALTEAIGSITPATIVVGVDPDSGLRISHQLPSRRSPQ